MKMKWKNTLSQGCCKTGGLNRMLVFPSSTLKLNLIAYVQDFENSFSSRRSSYSLFHE